MQGSKNFWGTWSEMEETSFFPPPARKEWSPCLAKVACLALAFAAGAILRSWAGDDYGGYFGARQLELFTVRCDQQRKQEDGSSDSSSFIPQRSFTPARNMTDEELFWKASMVPAVRKYPFRRVPKVAFMFLARGPLPLLPLWDRFFRGHEGLYSVYVHTSPGYRLNVSESSAFHGRQIPSQEVSWGSITLLDAEKRLLANALLDFSNERFVLLSESCVPVVDFATAYDYLVKSRHSFVQSFDEKSPRARGRYNRLMAPRIVLSQWRKGSQWFELHRQLAVEIVADSKYHAVFREHCRPSCYPDEHYLPTYLNMFHADKNANRSITWVDWSRGGSHPATYGRKDVTEEFIRSIRGSGRPCTYNSRSASVCFLFARKFAPDALGPLLNLAATVMNF